MATHDYVIANGTGAAVRSDLNDALAAIVSNNSSATQPTTTYSYMWWADTTAGQLKLRNAADDGWIVIQELDGTMLMEDGTAAAPGLAFASDLDTGIYRPTTNALGIATNGTAAIYVDASQRVGIGTTTVNRPLVVYNDSVGALALQNSTTGTAGSDGFQIQLVSSDGYVFNYENAPIIFGTNSTERARIDSSGRLLVGTTTAYGEYVGASSVYFGTLQIARNAFDGVAQFSNWTSNTGLDSNGGTQLFISRCKSGTVGSHTGGALSSGNPIGRLIFNTSDGTNFRSSAYITAEVDGAVSTADVPGRLVFSTTADGASSPTERMRINSVGAVNYYNASSDSIAARSGVSAGTGSYLYLGYNSATSTSNGTYCYGVYTNGNVENTNNSYAGISDIKLKENIVDASSQWDDLKAIQVRNYNFKEETGHETHTQLGVIAQEIELVSPGLVSEAPDRDDEGNDLGTVTKSVNYSVLYMKAVKALQEAMERIETLETKVAALEGN